MIFIVLMIITILFITDILPGWLQTEKFENRKRRSKREREEERKRTRKR